MPSLTILAVAAQATAAQVSIGISDAAVVVEATYTTSASSDSVRVLLAVLEGRHVDLAADGRLLIDVEGALWRVTVPPSADPERRVSLRYTVRGDLSRIPLPVPTDAMRAGVGSVELRVQGLPATAPLDRAFPRLAPGVDGWAVATLDNLPSVFRPPPPDGRWALPQVTEWVVLLLVGAASVSWTLRRRLRRP